MTDSPASPVRRRPTPVDAVRIKMVKFTPLRGTIFMTRSMFKSSSVFLGLLMVLPVFCSTVVPTRVEAGGQAQTTPLDEEGFEPLCNGKDLTGWTKEGNAGFEVKDGMIVCNGLGNWPTWLRTEDVFENFVLRLEFKTFYGAESGVFFHAPLHGRVSQVGFEVQIGGSGRLNRYSSGAISGAAAPRRHAARHWSDKEYDQLEIVMNWPSLRVTLNGELVQDLNCEEHELLRF